MPISQSDFHVNIHQKPIGAVIGMSKTSKLLFSNTSETERGYNLLAQVILPDGVSYTNSSISPTSIETQADGTIVLTWVNIKDLAPNETDFEINLMLKADEVFRQTGEEVPFDIPLENVIVKGTVDTLPRGDFDSGNEKITKEDISEFIPLRYDLIKTAPGKMPKGAGLISPEIAPMWPFEYTLTIKNNSISQSQVTLVDTLPNGVRYLGDLNVIGEDAALLSNPTIIVPQPGEACQDFVTVDWGSITLSQGSTNVVTFTVAIWDNYTINCVENSGDKIQHLTPLENTALLNGESGEVYSLSTTLAMDATIDKAVGNKITDVGQINNYTLAYRINQYDDVNSFEVTDTISDGQSYNDGSSSIEIDSVTINPDGTTILIWQLGLLSTGTTGNITFSTTVNSNYAEGNPVSARDTLLNDVDINGINQTTSRLTPDSSSVKITIKQPIIKKEILNYYYNDGTLKSVNQACPGDEIEFKITYSSEEIIASQRDIEVDEYAPLNMGPLTEDISVVYGGNLPGSFNPVTVSPNGLRWILGTIPGGSLWTAIFKVPVESIDFIGFRNNLAKLSGQNTYGLGYSDRDQVIINFGQPNIELFKSVNGPNINDIQQGQIYTYSITISNPQTEEMTTAQAFELELSDTIPDGLTYTGSFNVTGTGDYDEPLFEGQNVSMIIKKLESDDSLILSFDVEVGIIPSSGQTFINNAVLQRPYSQPNKYYQYPGEPFTGSAVLKAASLQLVKTIFPTEVKIGDTSTYTLKVVVPVGTKAYNVQVSDNFPISSQTYISGSATKDGVSITPDLNEGTVIFPLIPLVDASAAKVEIIYEFDIRVIDANHVAPYIDNQINNALVDWTIDEDGTQPISVNDYAVLDVKMPSLIGLKEQRNATQAGSFKTQPLQYNVGDVIEYRIAILNNGADIAFDSVITEVLDPLLLFNQGSITTSIGTATESDGTITWDIPDINVEETAILMFKVTTLSGVAAGGRISNNASFIYNSNNNGFGVTFGPSSTNTVRLRAPKLGINKQSSINEGLIGENINYTITITVPNGTIAYTPLIEDILPAGQEYIGPSTRQEPPQQAVQVIPTVTNETITFPINNDIDASNGPRSIIYNFTARITNANYLPPYEEIQTNTGKVSWAIVSGGSLTQEENKTLDILVKYPYITILKEQKNLTTGGDFTTNPIFEVSVGDIIEYKITLTNDGTSIAYNVITLDILDIALNYMRIVEPPPQGSVEYSDGTITWIESELGLENSVELKFLVKVNEGLAPGHSIYNQTSTEFDTLQVDPVTLGPELSNQVMLSLDLPEISKTVDDNTIFIGDTITYTIETVIPKDMTAYDVQVTDVLSSNQSYIPDSLTRNGVSIIPSPTLSFPFEGEIDANDKEVKIIYTFKAIAESMSTNPQDIQNNTATINWKVEDGGASGPPQSDSQTVYVTDISVEASKKQRNVTQGGLFTTDDIEGVVGDTIYYQLTVSNPSSQYTIFNVDVKDVLDLRFSYEGVITQPSEGEISYSGGVSNGVISWTIDAIPPLTSYEAVVAVKILFNGTANRIIKNNIGVMFSAINGSSISFGPIESNIVEVLLPSILSDIYILGQSDQSELINVGEEVRLDLQLSKNPHLIKASVIGHVTDIDGNPIQNAVVKILDGMYNPLYHTLTDENGQYFIMDIVSSSELHVQAVKQGYLLINSIPITLVPGQTVNLDFILNVNPASLKASIIGHVVDINDNPIENLTSRLYQIQNEEEIEVAVSSTNEYGQYAFMNVEMGRYIVKLTGDMYKTVEVEVLITEPGAMINLTTIMEIITEVSNGTINGVIRNSEGQPIEGAVVILYEVKGTTENPILIPVRYAKTIQGGAYLFGNVSTGRYIVKANKEE